MATPKNQISKINEKIAIRRRAGDVRQNDDSTREARTKLGNIFFIVLCIVVFFTMNGLLGLKALACIFIFCHIWYSHASLYYYNIFEGTRIKL